MIRYNFKKGLTCIFFPFTFLKSNATMKTDEVVYMAQAMTRRKYQQKQKKKLKKRIPNTRKKRRLRPWIFYLLITFFASILIFSVARIFFWQQDNEHIKEIEKQIEKDVKPKKNKEEGELINPPEEKESDYWYYVKMPFYEVDFNSLLAKNQDTVAFIHMNNTNVNYPVVQTTDNDYYLTHAYDHSNNEAGWVFMDYRSTLNPLGNNVILYGHGRLNKTVFGSLKNALTPSWQNNKDNYVIWLSTPQENLLYQIFSIYTIQTEGYYLKQDFRSDQEKETWITTMKQRNIAPIDTSVSISDNVLTLSTCENNTGGRIVIHAKLIKRQAR